MSPGLRYFLLLHATIAGLYMLWRVSAWLESATSRRAGARRWATLGNVFLLAAVTAPLLCAGLERMPATRSLLPGTPIAGRALGAVGGSGEVDGAREEMGLADDGSAPAVSDNRRPLRVDGRTAVLTAWALGALGLTLLRVGQWRRLRELLAGAVRVRRMGRVEILVHPEILSPFATRVRGPATVVVPSFLVESGRWRDAVRHELQHHRQRDPQWTLAWNAVTALLWINPAIWYWQRRLLELQELACDERLLERGAVSRAAYGETLLDVAEALLTNPVARQVAGCPSLAGRGSPRLLAQRLERVLDPSLLRRSSTASWIAWCLTGSGLWVAMAAGWAAGTAAAPVCAEVQLQSDLQRLTEKALAACLERIAARGGVVVAMDPASGAVLASAGFQWDGASRQLITDASAPYTRPFAGASTMKTLVVAGALQARAVDVADVFDTGAGSLNLDGRNHREWKDGGLGKVSSEDVIVKSSNLGAIQIARRLGAERLTGFLNQLGVAVAKDAPVADVSCGNCNDLSVTAHQLAYAYAALVNGGRDPRSGHPVVRQEVSDFIRESLLKAIREGTGAQARCNGITAGGKTGTSIREVDGSQFGAAYFVGFAPADAPRIVVSVIVDGLGSEANGSRHAAPLFREIVENGLPLLE